MTQHKTLMILHGKQVMNEQVRLPSDSLLLQSSRLMICSRTANSTRPATS